MLQGTIVKISGPLVVADRMTNASMNDVLRVGEKNLIGEIIELHGSKAYIQVYEDTAGVRPGEPVVSLEQPLSVVLGPGLIGSIYDGIQRPLNILHQKFGNFISRGVTAQRLDHQKKWEINPLIKVGDKVIAGDVICEVDESSLIKHRVLIPNHISDGEVVSISSGSITIEDTLAEIKFKDKVERLTLTQEWPVRRSRPYKKRLNPSEPLTTGQRVIDTFFPIAKGGTACVPGPFGSGKTVVQHQVAKWADAQVIIFIGCGERGNEMTDVLLEFPELIDPHSGKPLMERTILIANTSNMPVAAREASIYTGITLAEYYRDMGYNVAVMADSTSRWAEALREISGRLEEMPGEEGYPAYLGTRLAEFYERAGRVICNGSKERNGSVSIIGAVSPPGGDLSDPVVQATLRAVKVFWSLEDKLAYERHFPAINWLTSYSLYERILDVYLRENFGIQPIEDRKLAMRLLEEENELKEIVRLVGLESLSSQQRLILRTAQSIREDFLHQNAFIEEDTYTSLKKQFLLLYVIIHFYNEAKNAITKGSHIEDILHTNVMEKLAHGKLIPENELQKFDLLLKKITDDISSVNSAVSDNTVTSNAELNENERI
jgi:V/A-type H+-transporting ATPase subunit A